MYCSETHHWWYRGTHDLVARWVRREAGGRRVAVLDAGCGTGGLADLLRDCADMSCFDVSERAVAWAELRGLSRVRVGDVASIDYEESAFDVILLIDVLYHEWVESEVSVIRRLKGFLRPGGLMVIQVAAHEFLRGSHDIAVLTRRRYTLEEVCRWIGDAGLSKVSASYRMPWLLIPMLLSRRRLRQGAGSDLSLQLPSWIDNLLGRMVLLENGILLSGLPIWAGTSIFAVARRLEDVESRSSKNGGETSGLR